MHLDFKVKNIKLLLYALMPQRLATAAKTAIKAASVYLKGKVAQYPPETHAHHYQPFKTAKQRRYFFYALKAGIIEVPYRRGQSPKSEDHASSWTIATKDAGLTGVIGSDTTYGPFLQDKRRQSRYHALSFWHTVDDIVDAEGANVAIRIERIIAEMMGF